MATYDDLSLPVRLFMKGYPFSRYRVSVPEPARLPKPLAEARIALVTTAALYLPSQPKFDESIKMGDPSFREIPVDVDVQTLVEGHRSSSFDHTGVTQDRNLALPLDRFRELAERGVIGGLAPRHFSFMGSVVGPGRLINETAPEVAARLVADSVDAAFLTPV